MAIRRRASVPPPPHRFSRLPRVVPFAAAGLVFLLSATAIRCAGAGRPSAFESPSVAAEPHAARAVLVSVDGMAGERLERLLGEPDKLGAGGLRRLVDRGFYAVRSIPSTPSLTPAAHATHVTGAVPRDTGIVGNYLLDPTKPFGSRRSGFDVPLRAETLCEAAHRQGKRVGVIAYPHAAGTPPNGCSSFGLGWTSDPIARARVVRLDAAAWSAESPGNIGAFRGYSPARKAFLLFPPSSERVVLIAHDSTDDGRVDYDGLVVEPDSSHDAYTVTAGMWFPVEVKGAAGRAGSWCKVLSIAPDLSRVEIYVGAISEASAYPDDFRRALDEQAGFWPGRADYAVFGPNGEHPEIYLEQSDRLTEFLARAAFLAASRTDWDLLFVYFSEVDAVEHHFLLVDPRQAGYTPERSKRFAGFIDHAYADADRVIAMLEALLTPRDALFVTSDHGMTPLRAEVYPNEILKRAGLLLPDATSRDGFDPSTPVAALATSGIAHVYVNPAAPPGTLDLAERTLRDYRMPNGESPWDRVVRRADAASLSLDAPESGDLILLAQPGIGLSSKRPGFAEGPSDEYGGHGYRAAFRDLDATFLAAGPGVPHALVAEISSTTIAARIAAAMGIAPPKNAAPLRESPGAAPAGH